MASKNGANTGIILKPQLVFDTPTAPGAGHKIRIDSEDFKRNTTELADIAIGGQVIAKKDSVIGDDAPGGTISTKVRTDDAYLAAIFAFLGNETSTLKTAGVYEHSGTFNTTSLVNFLHYAKETDTANVEEYLNGVVTNLTFDLNVNDHIKSSASLVASKRLITGTTATNANILAATEPTNYAFVMRDVDSFKINVFSSGALSGGDVLAVTGVTLSFDKPYEYKDEARGAAGKGQPVATGEPPLTIKVTVQLKERDGNTFWTGHDAGTEYKAQLSVQGPLISGANYHMFRWDLPKLKVVTEPQYSLSSTSVNPVTIEFEGFAASAAPTGMGSTLPMYVHTNDKAAKYLV